MNGMLLLRRYKSGIAATQLASALAKPAPATPIPQPKIKNGSNKIFTIFPRVVHNKGVLVSPT
jgi:hypothetical protein